MDAAERSVNRYGRLLQKTLMDQLISGARNDQSDARASKLMVSVLNTPSSIIRKLH
jgi:3'-phosphoadenosine 5'-phosphosulfate sulfotransferase (PAPS reductase)/FAD synthetase